MAGSQRNGAPRGSSTERGNGAKDADENTPLLTVEDVAPTAVQGIAEATTLDEPSVDEIDRPLPRQQIFLLCYARLVEPISFFCIFPFISQMVRENGDLGDADVGFYCGLIESMFSLTQMAVMVFWGKASDRIGRKPVLVFSLAGVTIATSIFGMATTIWQMILFRCLAGVFAGSIVTIRTMISEHSTAKTQARAFSLFAFTGNMGILFGPLIGALADPVRQYPSLFKDVQFFIDYPFALPNLVVGVISLSAVIVTAFFVDETLAKTPPASDGTPELVSSEPPPPSTWKLLQSPGVAMALYGYGHVMLLAFAYTAIIPVFWFTPVALGGYGLSPLRISLLMGIQGFGQAFWTLVVFTPLQRRIGTTGMLRVCALAAPPLYATQPLFNALLRLGGHGAETAFWVTLPLTQAVGCGISMAFTAVQLAINDVSPTPRALGTLNALALTESSGIRAFSPALFSVLFAVGARTQWLGGYAIWALMVVISLAWAIISRYIPDYDEIRREREKKQAERAE